VHLVRPGPWPSSAEQEAVTFFADGQVLRSYRIEELVDFPSLMLHSVSHFMWRWKSSLDDKNKTYHLRTLHGEVYTFDITTGKMTFSFRTPRWILGLVALALVVLIWRRERRSKS
jgi:hypothetical protein